MIAPSVPAVLAPPAPFPLVLSQTKSERAIAPGIRRATYDLATSAGPLVVQVVAVDAHEPTVRLGSVIAHDRLVSEGETVSSMARRTGAVAGVNADYFDIGGTNQPLNIVVRDGTLLRSPSKRIALDVRLDRSVHIENFTFAGSATYGDSTVPVTTLNEWPPQGGAGLITGDFGSLRAAPGVTVANLALENAARPATASGGVYRVTAVGDAGAASVASGLSLAFGPAAQASAAPPQAGDELTLSLALSPSLEDVSAAVGGGPLLARDGAAASDPNAPAPEERDVRFPVAGAAVTSGGTVLFVSVDGRERSVSVGVTRPELGALMLGLGAADALAFDSGGSATLVARELGDADASVSNVPSDGEERPVADGLFAYSDAPAGPPAQLVVRPSPLVVLPGVDVPVRLALVDAAGHALGPAHLAGGDIVRRIARTGIVTLRANDLVANVPVRVVTQLARLDVAADSRGVRPGALLALHAIGRDASGAPVQLGNRATWSADRGSFEAPGRYRTSDRDARVVAHAGGASATYVVRVGSHAVSLDVFGGAHASAWTFATAPRGLAGSLRADPIGKTLALGYDFTQGARAAYATTSFALPGEPLTFSVDVEGDASGVGLRAAFVNAFGERRALTLVKSVDWSGWQTRSLALPDDLNPPVRLVALYAVPSLGGVAVRSAGTVRFRAANVVVAGSP